MFKNEDDKLHMVVAILTCERPEMLDACIAGMDRLTMPSDCRVTVLVVDNDKQGTGSVVASKWMDRLSCGTLVYVQEVQRGIPIARNRALDEANAMNARILCFIDDDEIPEATWLVNLLGCWRRSGAQLIGGPVFVAEAPAGASTWQRVINNSLQRRASRKMARTAAASKGSRKYTIVTNNWLCDLEWQRLSGVRFDESLRFTGGSDTQFFRTAKRSGVRSEWCENAAVLEEQDLSRLSLAYQFFRAASQSLNHHQMEYVEPSARQRITTVLSALVKSALGIAVLLVPVYGVASLVISVRSLGWSYGRIKALFGARSELYKADRP